MGMRFDVACHTDTGLSRKVNQDSACAMTALLRGIPICMLVLCDGMGGASMGEYASRCVVMEFADWFEHELPALAEQEIQLSGIRTVWTNMLVRLDEEMRAYGRRRGLKLGTTATCMLFWKGDYLLMQSGDSRAYEIYRRATQLTEDQSYVQQQVRMGRLTSEEARRHPRRNVLTDCVGGSRPSVPKADMGKVRGNAVYLLCSDGLVHEVEERELSARLSPWRCSHISALQEGLVQLTELVKKRGETDNITAIGMRIKKERGQEKAGIPFLLTEKMILCDSGGETIETSGEENED